MNTKFMKLAITACLLVTATFSTGCYKMSGYSQNGSESGPNGPNGLGGGIAGSAAQVINFRSVAKSYSNLTGVPLSAGANTLLANDLLSYSLDSGAATITAPMMYNQAKLAAEVCLSLVNKEKVAGTPRKFFNGINFAAAPSAQIAAGAFDEPINQHSRIICGHDASASLKADLRTLLTEATAANNTVADTDRAALLVCSSFLASSCTLTNN